MGELLKQPLAPIFDNTDPLQPSGASKIKQVEAPRKSVAEVVKEKPTQSAKSLKTKPIPENLPPIGVSIRRGHKAPEKSPDKVGEPHTPLVKAERKVTQEAMEAEWMAFANNQEAFIKQTLTHAHPTLKNELEIHITLENSFKEEKVKEIQSELLPYLREKLANKNLAINIHITEELTSSRAYTPKEKLELMLKDNPALAKLIDVLDLEME